jgi:hypothetical protein
VNRFSVNAALVDVRRDGGVVEAVFYGPLTVETIRLLGLASAKATAGTMGLILRLDKAALLASSLDGLDDPNTFIGQRIHGAVIVSPEQRPVLDDYSRKSAAHGIMRAVFLPWEYPLAVRWAHRQTRLASLSESQR